MPTTARTPVMADPTPSPASPARRSRPRRWLRRALQGLALVTGLALLGAGLQEVAQRRDATAHPPPGELVTLPDGRQLHLQIAGEEHDGPTVILEGGAGASTPAWGWVQPAVAEHATVVAYDRAGLGWSDPSPEAPSAAAVLTDLRDALDARRLPGPYVLVGHSLGGHYVRAFAEAHPDDVAGIVLVDPSHEHAADVLGMNSDEMWPMLTALKAATRLGLLRLYNPFATEITPLPQPQRDQALSQMVDTSYARTFAAEMAALDSIGATLPTGPGVLGDVPLRVLIALGGATDPEQQRQVEELAELRGDMQSMSSDAGTITLDDASHVSIVTEREHARVVSDTIRDVVRRRD